MINRLVVCSCCFLLLFTPGLALAHSPIKGIDNFYNGILHPVFVPAHLLLLIAVGLFIGQQGLKKNQLAVAIFMGSTIIGLIMAWFSLADDMQVWLLTGAAIVGILTAINPVVGLFWCSFIAGLAGIVLGLDSTQETLLGKERMVALFGSGVGIYFLLLYPLGLADRFKNRHWQKTGIRVIGSWVAASSLLVLSLSLSQKL